MKVLTKAMVKDAAQFVAMVDYKTGKGNNGYDYHDLKATTILEAMDEAAEYKTDDVYLVKIGEKFAYNLIDESIPACVAYHTILTCHSYNWHPDTARNSEGEYFFQRCFWKYGKEVVSTGFSHMDENDLDMVQRI